MELRVGPAIVIALMLAAMLTIVNAVIQPATPKGNNRSEVPSIRPPRSTPNSPTGVAYRKSTFSAR